MFFDKKKESDLIKVSALLIHAAKIDQNYSSQEQKIIKQTLREFGADVENSYAGHCFPVHQILSGLYGH